MRKSIGMVLVSLILVLSSLISVGADLSINEFLPRTVASEWIEVYNNGTGTVDLDGFLIGDEITNFTIPSVLIGPNEFIIFASDEELFNATYPDVTGKVVNYSNTFILNNNGDNISLYNSSGELLDEIIDYSDPGKNVSIGRFLDGSDNIINLAAQTPGSPNDNLPPVFNDWVIPDSNGTNVAGLLNVTVNVTDQIYTVNTVILNFNGSNMTMLQDGDEWYFEWDTTLNNDGPYTLNVTANDTVGLTSTDSILDITVDNTPPSVASITYFNDDRKIFLSNNSNVSDDDLIVVNMSVVDVFNSVTTVELVVRDPTGAEVDRLTAGNDFGNFWSVKLEDVGDSATVNGTHSFTVETTDSLTNLGSVHTTAFYVDNEDPIVSILLPDDGSLVKGVFALIVTAMDFQSHIHYIELDSPISPAANFTFLAGNDLENNWTINVDTTLLSDGANVFDGTAFDHAGNINFFTATRTYTIDNTEPVLTNLQGIHRDEELFTTGANLSSGEGITLNVTATDATTSVDSVFFHIRNVSGQTAVSVQASNTADNFWTADHVIANPPLINGTYTVTAQANDSLDNIQTLGGMTLNIDLIDPGLEVYLPQGILNVSGNLSFLIGGMDNETGVETINIRNGTVGNTEEMNFEQGDLHTSNWSYVIDSTAFSDGGQDFRVTVFDYAQNFQGQTIEAVLDNTPPVITFIVPLNGTNHSQNFTLNVSVVDPTSGVQSVTLENGSNGNMIPLELTVGNISNGFWTTDIDTTAIADGFFNFTVNATDHASNQDGSEQVTIIVDNTPPNVFGFNGFVGQNANLSSNTFVLNATANDTTLTVSTLRFVIANDTGNPFPNITGVNTLDDFWTAAFDTSILPDENYTVTIYANDTVGNLNDSEFIDITIDKTVPEVNILAPQNNTNSSGTITFNVEVIDHTTGVKNVTVDNGTGGVPVALDLISGTMHNGTWSGTIDSTDHPDITTDFTVTARDHAGNINNSEFVTINIDNTVPTDFFLNPLNNTNVSMNITLHVAAFDVKTGVEFVEVQNGTNGIFLPLTRTEGSIFDGNWSFNLDTTTLPDGPTNFTARVTDFAGNVNNSEFVTVVIDNQGPENITFHTPIEGQFVAGSFVINVSVNDSLTPVDNVLFQLHDSTQIVATITPEKTPFIHYNASYNTLPQPDGAFTLSAVANDSVGNLNARNISIFIDNTPPEVTLVQPANNSFVNNGNQEVLFTVTDTGSGVNQSFIDGFSFQFDIGVVKLPVTDILILPIANGFLVNGTVDLGTNNVAVNITVDAKDNVSNIADTYFWTYTIDQLAPSINNITINQTDIKPGDFLKVHNGTSLNVTINVTNGAAGVSSVILGNQNTVPLSPLQGDLWSVVTTSEALGCADGNCTVFVNATDGADNVNQSESFLLIVDNDPAKILLYQQNDTDRKVKSTDVLSFNVTLEDGNFDDGSTVTIKNLSEISLIKQSEIGNQSKWHIDTTASGLGCALSDGLCTVTLTATDIVGNQNATETIVLTVDDIPPALTVQTNDTNNIVPSNSVLNFSVDAIDTNAVSDVEINSSPLQQLNTVVWSTINTTSEFCSGIVDATCSLEVFAVDEVGNEQTLGFTLSIDDTPPVFTSVDTSDADNLVGANDVIDFIAVMDDTFGIESVVMNGTTLFNTVGLTFETTTSPGALSCTDEGTCTVEFTAIDNAGNSNSEQLTITIDNTPPTFSNIDHFPKPVNNTQNVTLFTDWFDGNGMNVVLFEHNASGAFINVTGENTVGTTFEGIINTTVLDNREFIAWRSIGIDNAGRINDSMEYQFFLVENRAPLTIPIPTINWSEGSSTTLNLSQYFTDPDGDPLTYVASDAENVTITIDQAESIATFTSDFSFFGLSNTTFTAFDGINETNSSLVILNVTFVNNEPPVVSTIPDVRILEDEFNDTINLSKFVTDGDTLVQDINWTVTYTNNSNELPISINQTTKLINITPVLNFNGVTEVVFHATDGVQNVQSNFVLVDVIAVNDAPEVPTLIAPPDTQSTTRDVDFDWSDATDVEGDTVFYYFFIAPTTTPVYNATVFDSNITLTNLTIGATYHWNVIASDDLLNSTSSTFEFTVVGNNAPQITSFDPPGATVVVFEDNTQDFSITTQDLDGDPLTVEWTLNSSVQSSTTNDYTFTAVENGTFNLTVVVSDGQDQARQEWVVFVPNESNQPPFITSSPNTEAVIDELYTYDVNAEDPEGGVLTFSLTENPDRMTIDANSGVISWTPNSTQTGDHTVTVQVSDGELTDIDTFTVKVGEGSKLRIVDVDVKVDGKSDSNVENGSVIARDAQPGDKLSFGIEVENFFTDEDDISIEDVEVRIDIIDIDDGDDIDEDSGEFNLDTEESENVDLDFRVPKQVNEDIYDVEIKVDGVDTEGVRHEIFWLLRLEVDKENHEVLIDDADFSPESIVCHDSGTLFVDIVNTGADDEDQVVIEVMAPTLEFMDKDYDILLDEGTGDDSTYAKQYAIPIPSNLDTGEHLITVNVYYNEDELSDTQEVLVAKRSCERTPTTTSRPTRPVVSPPGPVDVVIGSTVVDTIQPSPLVFDIDESALGQAVVEGSSRTFEIVSEEGQVFEVVDGQQVLVQGVQVRDTPQASAQATSVVEPRVTLRGDEQYLFVLITLIITTSVLVVIGSAAVIVMRR